MAKWKLKIFCAIISTVIIDRLVDAGTNNLLDAPNPFATSNPFLQIGALLIRHCTPLPASDQRQTQGNPHLNADRAVPFIFGSMYEAMAIFSNYSSSKRLTNIVPAYSIDVSLEENIFYAGYASMRVEIAQLGFGRDVIMSLDADVLELGYSRTILRELTGMPISNAVKNMLGYAHFGQDFHTDVPHNPPSLSDRVTCSAIKYPTIFQMHCRDGMATCSSSDVEQRYTGTNVINAILVANRYLKEQIDIYDHFPQPHDYDRYENQFIDLLHLGSTLGDYEKAQAEIFDRHGIMPVIELVIQELFAREGLSVEQVGVILLSTFLASYDSSLAVKTLKEVFNTARPESAIACGMEGHVLTSWNEPYMGVQTYVNDQSWRPFRPEPNNPSYPGGNVAVINGGVYAFVSALSRVQGQVVSSPRGPNCYIWKKGSSAVEPKISKGEAGYVEHLTDVPNQGYNSIGYSPARDTQFCWKTFDGFLEAMAKSRIYAGLDTNVDNDAGDLVARRVTIMHSLLLDQFGFKTL